MQITGRIIEISPLLDGVSQSGKPWQKQDVHIEEEKQYPNALIITFFGDKVKKISTLSVGELVTIDINTSVNEFNGRKFNNINGWKVTQQAKQTTEAPPLQPAPVNEDNEGGDDLPF